MHEPDTQDLSEHEREDRRAYSDFLPRFRALIELGNYSEDLETSVGLIRVTKEVYERIHKDPSDPFHSSLRKIHEQWWLQGQPGRTRIYWITTQYLRPATYRLTVSCDDDEGTQHFFQTKDIFNNSKNLEDIAHTLVRNVISMFK